MMNKKQEIRQNGENVLSSNDGISIPMIFNNLTGVNAKNHKHYRDYIQHVAIPHMGFTYGEIELVIDGVTVKKGVIAKDLES